MKQVLDAAGGKQGEAPATIGISTAWLHQNLKSKCHSASFTEFTMHSFYKYDII